MCGGEREKTLKTNFDLSVPSFPSFPSFPPSFFSIYGFLAPKPPLHFSVFFSSFFPFAGKWAPIKPTRRRRCGEEVSLSLSSPLSRLLLMTQVPHLAVLSEEGEDGRRRKIHMGSENSHKFTAKGEKIPLSHQPFFSRPCSSAQMNANSF